MEYDEIEYFKNDKSVYKTCLPEGSTIELRTSILNHALVISNTKHKYLDRVVILTKGKIRLDSDKDFALKKELGLIRYNLYISDKESLCFWGRMFHNNNGVFVETVETNSRYFTDKHLINIDKSFYKKHGIEI